MDAAKAEDFMRELTKLSHQFGVGITSGANLYMLENDDHMRTYRLDDDSNLQFS